MFHSDDYTIKTFFHIPIQGSRIRYLRRGHYLLQCFRRVRIEHHCSKSLEGRKNALR